MEMGPTGAREMRDAELNEAFEVDGLSVVNQRLAKVQEYEEAALLRSDPFAAVIGMGNAYFQRVFEHLGAAILDELDSHAHSVEELRELEPEIRLLVKLRNSIETDLAVQPDDARQPAAACPRRMNSKKLGNNAANGSSGLLPKRWRENA